MLRLSEALKLLAEGNDLSDEARKELKLRARDHMSMMLSQLTRREEKVIRLRWGLGDGRPRTHAEIATIFQVSTSTASRWEKRALEHFAELDERYRLRVERKIHISEAVGKVTELTPELIYHLKVNHEDIGKIPWDTAEHLIAEYLASRGFEDVRLVGRDRSTGADIYAARIIVPTRVPFRLFVEVKWRREKVGIEVIDQVLGAYLAEKQTHGWTAALLVSLAGYKDFRRETPQTLKLKSLELQDKDDLLMWLDDYQPSPSGLWLPEPLRAMDSGG